MPQVQTFTDIPAVTDRDTAGKRIYQDLEVIREDDVDYDTLPTIDEDALTTTPLTLKESAAAKTFKTIVDSQEDTSTGQKGDITSTVTNEITVVVGDTVESRKLVENHIGDRFFVIHTDKYTRKKYLHGRPYFPMVLTDFTRSAKESKSIELHFKNESFFQPLEVVASA